MARTLRHRAGLLVAVLTGCAWVTSAYANDIRIRKVTLQGHQLYLYHERIVGGASAEVKIKVGGRDCEAVPSDALKPGRGGDQLTTLIVLDRGGTDKSGMGQYTDAIRIGVQRFVDEALSAGVGDKVTLIDSPGRSREAAKLPATADKGAVKDFLAGLQPPAGSGADIYGTANVGLSLLDGVDSRLRAVIIISDGIDPDDTGDNASQNNLTTFIAEARRRGIPVAAVHVERAGEKARTQPQLVKGHQGRTGMLKATNDTNGEFRSVVADRELGEHLYSTLHEFGVLYGNLDRTACKLCGKYDGLAGLMVDMQVVQGGKVLGRSRSEPVVQLVIPSSDFGACGNVSDAVVPADAATCKLAEDCTPCGACADGHCKVTTCKSDTECNQACTCREGSCQKRKTLRDYAPLAAGGLAILAVALLVWSQMRKRARLRVETAKRAEQERALATQAAETQQAALHARIEQERAERERLERQAEAGQRDALARAQAQDAEMARLRESMTPVLLRLVSQPQSSVACDKPLRAGTFVIGAQPGADIQLEAQTVSGQHARLHVSPQGVGTVTDLGSSNGTFVNQYRLQPQQPVELRFGDQLGISSRVVLEIVPIS